MRAPFFAYTSGTGVIFWTNRLYFTTKSGTVTSSPLNEISIVDEMLLPDLTKGMYIAFIENDFHHSPKGGL